MRHPAPGRGGFTLVEVLVTLFVIAVIAGVAVLRIDDRDSAVALDTEARRLARVVELAREEAILDGREWGMRLDGTGYDFVRLDADGELWEVVEARPFDRHDLPDTMSLRLRLESRDRVGVGDTAGFLRATEGRKPALLLLSSGEMTPFELLVLGTGGAGDEASRRLHSDGFARVTVDPDGTERPGGDDAAGTRS